MRGNNAFVTETDNSASPEKNEEIYKVISDIETRRAQQVRITPRLVSRGHRAITMPRNEVCPLRL